MKIIAATVSTALIAAVKAQQVIESKYEGKEGLNDVAKLAGKFMGTVTDHVGHMSPAYNSAYMLELHNTQDWGMISPDTVMNQEWVQDIQGSFDFVSPDLFLKWASGMDYKVRCRPLVWHLKNPEWYDDTMSGDDVLEAITNYVETVVEHYGDRCYSWDVVTEAIGDDGKYRDSLFYNAAGAAYIAQAFKVANEVKEKLGLNVKLYYNDYGIEDASSEKGKFAQTMIKELLSQGIKIDGVGFESRFTAGKTPSKADLVKSMKFYTDLGLDVAVTELTIAVPPPASTELQVQQAKDYEAVIGACKATAKCVSASTWEFIDSYVRANETMALPFYEPKGVSSESDAVRKGVYDAIINGWKA